MKVFASIYSTFLQRAFDNVFHDVCLQELPVIFAIDRGGISGPDGATHHGIYDISFLNAMPNMIISQPRDGQLLKELMESAPSWGQPAAIRYPNMATEDREEPLKQRSPGKGEILEEGEDILIVSLGHMNQTAYKVRELLQEQGYNPTLMDPIFIKPLDSELICKLLMTHKKIITLEEHSVVSGLGSILNNFLLTHGYTNIQVLNLGIPETYLEQGSHSELIKEIGLSPEQITHTITQHFNLKNNRLEAIKI